MSYGALNLNFIIKHIIRFAIAGARCTTDLNSDAKKLISFPTAMELYGSK